MDQKRRARRSLDSDPCRPGSPVLAGVGGREPQVAGPCSACIPLLTAAAGRCPLYSLCGISTCPVKKGK